MIENRVPGMSQNLPAKYSVYGDPLQTGTNIIGTHNWVTGGNRVAEQTDPAKLELDRLNSVSPSALITPVLHTVPTYKDGEEVTDDDGKTITRRLSTAEFEQYQHLAGINIVANVKQEMQTPEWQAMTDKEKIAEVRAIQTDIKAAAKKALFNK